MNNEDIKYLEKAINNENNEALINLTFDKIEKKKRKILEELDLSKKDMNALLKKLEDYRYVEEIQELQYGHYMRWINLTDPENLELNTGATLSDIKIEDNTILVMKNFASKRYFEIVMDENYMFQKLSTQEKVILYALDVC